MGHIINKSFDFCYGHRVWSQELIEGYVEDMCLKCRHLHGHQGKITVYLENMNNTNELENGMVTDFKHLGWFKKWLDDTLDHKFIMHNKDPLLNQLFPLWEDFMIPGNDDYHLIYENNYDENGIGLKSELKELYEGLVMVDFVPTSENLSKWFCEIINNKMNKIGVKCVKIEFNETPKSQAIYINN